MPVTPDHKLASIRAFHRATNEERDFNFPYCTDECMNAHQEEVFAHHLLHQAIALWGEENHSATPLN